MNPQDVHALCLLVFFLCPHIYRGRCLDELSMLPQSASFDMPAGTVTPVDGGIHDATNERQFVSSSKPVWKTGYQKYVYFSTFDAWKLFWDPK